MDNIELERARIESCTAGKTSDSVEFARGLRGKHVSIDTFGLPATPEIVRDLQTSYWGNETIWQILMSSGGQMTENAGRAACLGGLVDTFGRINKAGNKCINAANRNFPGRMGDKESQVFLACADDRGGQRDRGQGDRPVEFFRLRAGDDGVSIRAVHSSRES